MPTTPTTSPDRWDADDLWLTGVDVHLERMDDSCINIVFYNRSGARIGNVDIFTRTAEKVETIVERDNDHNA